MKNIEYRNSQKILELHKILKKYKDSLSKKTFQKLIPRKTLMSLSGAEYNEILDNISTEINDTVTRTIEKKIQAEYIKPLKL